MRQLIGQNENFQPMNFNFGLLPHVMDYKKKDKKRILGEAAEKAIREWIASKRLPSSPDFPVNS